jgi:DnaJ-class molecular chaperone
MPGEGGGKDGDLTVEVKYEAHKLFSVQGKDLYVEVPVRLDEAAEGAKVKVPTPDGEVTIKLPADTQSGKLLKIAGRGLRSAKGERGDLLVRVIVETPRLNETQREALAALLRELPHDRRALYTEALRAYHAKTLPAPAEPSPKE